jgi:nitrilase
MQIFRAAVIQAASVAFDPARTMEKLAALVSEAAGKGVKLALLPEAFVGGYPKGLDFGARRHPEGPLPRRFRLSPALKEP